MKNCVCEKQIHHFNFKPSLLAIYKSIIHDNTSSSEKVHPLLCSHIKSTQIFFSELIWTVFACKQCLIIYNHILS